MAGAHVNQLALPSVGTLVGSNDMASPVGEFAASMHGALGAAIDSCTIAAVVSAARGAVEILDTITGVAVVREQGRVFLRSL